MPSQDSDTGTLRELPNEGKVPDILKEMEITDMDGGYFVPLKRVAYVRVVISQVHTYTDKVFTSKQIDDGIIIWREK